MRRLWNEPDGARARFARQVLTARASTLIVPGGDLADDAPRLIASMLTAGLDRQAARWWGAVPQGGDAWAMLSLADPRGRRVPADAVESYAGGGAGAALKTRMLLAGLVGLGVVAFARVTGRRIAADTALPFGALLAVAAYPAWIAMIVLAP